MPKNTFETFMKRTLGHMAAKTGSPMIAGLVTSADSDESMVNKLLKHALVGTSTNSEFAEFVNLEMGTKPTGTAEEVVNPALDSAANIFGGALLSGFFKNHKALAQAGTTNALEKAFVASLSSIANTAAETAGSSMTSYIADILKSVTNTALDYFGGFIKIGIFSITGMLKAALGLDDNEDKSQEATARATVDAISAEAGSRRNDLGSLNISEETKFEMFSQLIGGKGITNLFHTMLNTSAPAVAVSGTPEDTLTPGAGSKKYN